MNITFIETALSIALDAHRGQKDIAENAIE